MSTRLGANDIDLEGDFDDGRSDPLALESPVLAQVQGASVLGRVATGPRAGPRVMRWGSDPTAPLVTTGGPRQTPIAGFDLHANVAVRAGENEEKFRDTHHSDHSEGTTSAPRCQHWNHESWVSPNLRAAPLPSMEELTSNLDKRGPYTEIRTGPSKPRRDRPTTCRRAPLTAIGGS